MPSFLRLFVCLLLVYLCQAGLVHARTNQRPVLLMSEELDDKGKVIPLSPEVTALLRYLEQHSGLTFDIRRYPWKRALENAEKGEGLIFGISKTRERLRSFKFSQPIFTDQSLLVTRCDSKFVFQSLDDLKGKTIGIVRGTSNGDKFDRLSNVLFKVEDDTSNNSGRLKKLYLGRMDAFLLYSSASNISQLEANINRQYAAEFAPGQTTEKLFCVLPKPVSSVDIHIAIRPDLDKGLMLKIDRAILRAHQEGELSRIYSQR
ncbi:transporter substrate-binding domain-containing protein [Undibacterium sp. CY18W]|uniref:Transporter substrate-binding domain-containing protein n=1 Tax=Undibacterium hunanense TaxID=2762292 RepID=A0ABR6ZLF1_9BURK|nr:transporter substrate-binding domain-containing protein [Undibacterium hunanense]MBC3916614.1 transporter substrate-binding domain-containing protein [Undibacterium hunanense]